MGLLEGKEMDVAIIGAGPAGLPLPFTPDEPGCLL